MDEVARRTPDGEVRPGDLGRSIAPRRRLRPAGDRALAPQPGGGDPGRRRHHRRPPRGFPPVQGTVAWADPILDALAAVRRDPSVRAVVLRVNSPGGSAFASDRIAREMSACARPQAGDRVDGRHGGLGRLLHGGARRGDHRLPLGDHRVNRDLRLQAGRDRPGREAGRADRDLQPRGARRPVLDVPGVDARRTPDDVRPHGLPLRQFLRTVADGRKQKGITEDRADQLGKGKIYTGAQALAPGLVDRWAASPTPSTRPPAAAGCRWAPAACPRW